jgi:hypothetical protein
LTSVSTWNSARAARRFLVAAGIVAMLLAAPSPAPAGDEEGCLGCHGLPGFALRDDGGARQLAIDTDRLDASAHGDLGCRDCHAEIASIPHGEQRDVGCGQPCHRQEKGGKEYSHEGLYWEYAASVHGSSRSRKIGCLLCHPSPERRETAERDKLEEVRRCASCHRDHPRVRAWFSDRHFLELAGGNRRAPSCPDCHSAHRVRPAAASESTVNGRRLAATCANGALGGDRRSACHGPLGEAAVAGASMNPLPRGGLGKDPLARALVLLAGALVAGLVVRAGVGLTRGR